MKRTELSKLLKVIEMMKPDVPSTAVVEVEMADLETFYTEIKKMQETIEIQQQTINKFQSEVVKCQAKIDLLNDIAKASNKRFKINDYM